MSRAILYDSTLCIGCKACECGCAERWGLPYNDKIAVGERLSAHKLTAVETHGERFSRRLCMHCAEPTCVSVCPVGALTWLFALEIALMAVPTLLLYQRKVRMSPGALYACAVMVLFAFVANRLNVAVTGMEASSGTHYVPKWTEVAVTLSIVGAGFAIFRVIAEHFAIFEVGRPLGPHQHAPKEMAETEAAPVAVE